MTWLHTLPGPFAPIQAAFDRLGRVVYLGFVGHEPRVRLLAALEARAESLERDPAVTESLARQLTEYFAGSRRTFDLPLALEGTAFRSRVWEALLRIPYGETRTYRELARQLGDPGASRAIGGANGSNPVSILVPCHRVIGASGSLVGYAGGTRLKACLLRLEGALPDGPGYDSLSPA